VLEVFTDMGPTVLSSGVTLPDPRPSSGAKPKPREETAPPPPSGLEGDDEFASVTRAGYDAWVWASQTFITLRRIARGDDYLAEQRLVAVGGALLAVVIVIVALITLLA
jgi:hypothetical protein